MDWVEIARDLKKCNVNDIMNLIHKTVGDRERARMWYKVVTTYCPHSGVGDDYLSFKNEMISEELETCIRNVSVSIVEEMDSERAERTAVKIVNILQAFAGYNAKMKRELKITMLEPYATLVLELLDLFQGSNLNVLTYLVASSNEMPLVALNDESYEEILHFYLDDLGKAMFPEMSAIFEICETKLTDVVIGWMTYLFQRLPCGENLFTLDSTKRLMIWDYCFVFGFHGTVGVACALLQIVSSSVVVSETSTKQNTWERVGMALYEAPTKEFCTAFSKMMANLEVRASFRSREFKDLLKYLRKVQKQKPPKIPRGNLKVHSVLDKTPAPPPSRPLVEKPGEKAAAYLDDWNQLRVNKSNAGQAVDWLERIDVSTGVPYYVHYKNPEANWTWDPPECGFISSTGTLRLPTNETSEQDNNS